MLSPRTRLNQLQKDQYEPSGSPPASEPAADRVDERLLIKLIESPSALQLKLLGRDIAVEEPLTRAWLSDIDERVAYIYDFERQTFIEGGEKLATAYGYSVEEIHAMPAGWDSIIHPDDLATVRASNAELLEGEVELATVQMRIACKDGRWEWIQHDWRALERNAEGRMIRALGLVQFITSMALSAQALRNEASLSSLSRTLVEEWVDGIFLIDASWNILYANQGALDVLGYQAAELIGRPLQLVVAMDLGQRKTLPSPKPDQKLTLRGAHLLKDGSEHKVEIVLRRLPGGRLLATTRDIREQLANEEFTRRQADYYKGLFENNPSGVAVFDSKLQITKANPALRRMLGYTEKQFHQMRLPDLLASNGRPPEDFWRQLVEDTAHPTKEIEVPLRRREGRLLHAHAAVSYLCGAHEESGHGIIIFTDISARKQTEQELERQSQLNNTLLRESAAMIAMIGPDGRILQVNPAVEEVTGYGAKELVGKALQECGLADPAELPRFHDRLQELLQGAPRATAIARIRTKSGGLRVLNIHTSATRSSAGGIESYIITAVDITEQQRLQHHLMEAIEQEQARIGHDLHDGVGQLLTGIGAMVEMLQGQLSGGTEEEAARIYELVRQAIHQVRLLSRNMSPAAIQNRDLSASLLLLADTIRTNYRRQCECRIDPELRINDMTIGSHLFLIAQEAVNNAIRHGNPDKIILSLSRDDQGHGILEISNNGRSFDCKPGSEGIGLRVMNYRSSLIHADFSLNSLPSGGVKVTCKFPLPSGRRTPQAKTKKKPTP